MFTETFFFVGLYSALMGFVLAVINLLYRSKCKEVDICCIKVVRDIQIEEELDLQQIRPNPIQSQNNL
jgi:Flp pilus assembly protein protease CpaA